MRRGAWITLGLFLFVAAALSAAALRRQQAGRSAVADHDALAQSAARALQAGDYAAAIRLLRRVPDADGFAVRARVLEGQALWQLHRGQSAERAWKRALALRAGSDADAAVAGWELLRLYFVLQRGHDFESLVLWMYPIAIDERQRTLLLLELLRQEFERLSPGETVLELEPVVAAEADNFHALRVLGLSYVQLGRVREGLTLVERAVALHANQPDGWYTFAWCLYETGDLERLGRAWIEMPDSVRLDARLLRYRGMWAEKSAHPADAEAAYRSALERAPADRKAHYQLARVLRHRGAEQEAAEHEIAARSLDDSREALATCYTRAKQQHDNPGAELCREIGRLCRALGRIPLAVCWDREADRRT